jgi:hypothetical protein
MPAVGAILPLRWAGVAVTPSQPPPAHPKLSPVRGTWGLRAVS